MFRNPHFDGASPELCAGGRQSHNHSSLREVLREAVGLYKIVFTQMGSEHGANCAKSR